MKKTMTIFGSTGDLSTRKLFPALYNMYALNQLENTHIIAIGRKNYTIHGFIESIVSGIKEYARLTFDEEIFNEFKKRIHYFQMDLTNEKDYQNLNDYYKMNHYHAHTFYLALSPQYFHQVIQGLHHLDSKDSNIIIEKPFGKNTQDMIQINQKLNQIFTTNQIFYIDHYLGKEMIQNIKTIRFKNALFKNNWNHEMIESIQISALEKDGVLNRGAYYETSGALKDMVQNHMFQILSILTMEENENQHEAQIEILKKLKIKRVNLGQYVGYRNEKDVNENSNVETYAELMCTIENERWKDVPIYIRTGKKLERREIEVIVQFKSFDHSPNNILQIKIQPVEGIYLQFNIKKPGEKEKIETVKMDFCQNCVEINRINTPEAYERLLNEVFHHQRDFFASFEEICISSKLIGAINKPNLFFYEDKISQTLVDWIEIDH